MSKLKETDSYMDENITTELLENDGMMCRSCFSTLDRFSKLKKNIDNNFDELFLKISLIRHPHNSTKRMKLTQVSFQSVQQ